MSYRTNSRHHQRNKHRPWRALNRLTNSRTTRYAYGIVVIVLVAGYLVQVNATATDAIIMRDRIKTRDTLREQVADLQAQLIAAKDPTTIAAAAQRLDLTTSVTTHDVVPTAGLAMRH